jgi:hypothetical protein
VTHPFFNTSLRRDPNQPRDLRTRIDAQLAERIEEAVDFVCLEALVQARRARGLAEPAADSADDRAEFEAGVEAFLERLERELTADLTAEQQRKLAPGRPGAAESAERVKVQTALARERPDYWQRFEEIRTTYTAEYVAAGGPPGASRGERRSALHRFLRGG